MNAKGGNICFLKLRINWEKSKSPQKLYEDINFYMHLNPKNY